MSRTPASTEAADSLRGPPLWVKIVVALLIALAVAVVLVSNRWLTERFVEATRDRSDVRLTLYSGNVVSELQRTAVVPLLLVRDPDLIAALKDGDFSRTSARLIRLQSEIGVASIRLLDTDGKVVAATNRHILGTSSRNEPYFVAAQRTNETVFTAVQRDSGGYEFTYSRAVRTNGKVRGVIVVSVDLAKYERTWTGLQDAMVLTDSEGKVMLTTMPGWRGKALSQSLTEREPDSVFRRAAKLLPEWISGKPDAWLHGEPSMMTETRIPFRGWRLYGFTGYGQVREQVNGILALVITGFAILASLTFYLLSRRARQRSLGYQRESAELRGLNARLQREIAEREKVEANLQVAEQTIEQSSKLAVLGEMSASISHELNQPLAAMKTYLAGARLLLQRNRRDEALSSFQRIDDLIERMGAITRQLKSYVRKGGEAFEPVDFKACLSAALAMMEPQLRQRYVRITRGLPREDVMVMADRLRLEQVIINLLRNALDALREVKNPQIDILLSVGETATLTIRDNGPGIDDLDHLFEPFYTTKLPGEGVGLGLAISSGIVADLGGRLVARNGEESGAVFELQLPILDIDRESAEKRNRMNRQVMKWRA